MSHMQWVPSSHYMSIASTFSHFSSMAHVVHTSVFVWTNHLFISTWTLISSPKLSLNYQNQTRTFQTCTNFPRLTRRLGARWATPSRLGAQNSKSNKCNSMISAKLKCSRFTVLFAALKQSLYQTQYTDITRITQSHKREVGESSTKATKLLGTTSKQQNRAWNNSPPRRVLRSIHS